MKKGTTRTLMVGLLIAGTASSYASWTVDSSIAAAHLGGPSQRTFSTYAEAKAYVDANPNYGLRILPGGVDDNAAGGSAGGNYSSDPRLQLAGQIGYAIGQALHKEIFGDPQADANNLNNKGIQYCNQGQWGLAVDAFEAALRKLPRDQTIANNLAQARQRFAEEKQEAEERRKQEEKERQEAIARRKQETYDRLSSQLKLSNGNGGGLSLKDVRMGDGGGGLSLKDVRMGDSDSDNSNSGHVGIRGLPGLYLNDTSGQGTDKPYGIPGLPGLYVNGPGSGSGLAQPGEARPQAGGAGNEPPATLANDTPNAPLNDNSGNGNALGSRGTYTAATAPGPANNIVTQPATGTPPPQTTLGPVPESLQQQATASQAAAAAPILEDASAKARAGFDTALPPANQAPGALGSGARSPATPVPPRTEPTAAVPVTASPAVVQPARTAPVTAGAASPAVIPGGGMLENPIKEFLFPGKPKLFPENPDQPLLNPLIEKAKASSLPTQGETAEDFFARFQQSGLYRKANPLPPWNSGPAYPRGKYPAVDAAVDAALQHINERETAGLQDACRKAVVAMNAEFAQMERRGVIRAGEDLTKKEETDVVYENALMSARHRVYAQLERDVSATLVARDNALDRLKLVDIPEMQKQAAEANKSDVEKYLFPASKP